MSVSGMDWFRWHNGSVTDPKFQLVARKAGASLPDVLAVWAFVLETANQSADRGSFGAIDAETLDCLFNFPDTETRTADILRAMEQRGLILEGRVVSWEKRQPKREREDNTAAERKRRQRDRDAADDGVSESVTPCHAMSHQKTPREEESREEEKTPPQTLPKNKGGSGSASPAPRTTASRLPDDWTLSKALGDWALQERPDWTAEHVRKVAEQFRDHWHAQGGANARKVDWAAAWRTWVRREPASRVAGAVASAVTAAGWSETDDGFIAKGRELGIERKDSEPFVWFTWRVARKVGDAGVIEKLLSAAERDGIAEFERAHHFFHGAPPGQMQRAA
ncbi:hypothetical protein [Ralstonia insidiosa]|uniref:DnaT DNA-binding domain-containing protein n=1 Tax=Ralstonia insidiosa TaxID=190721 RepID=A0A848NVK9_9RALS|nr:hypothetical protein [Ralstonia insidiosa]NMV37227.1 hypothetical protein [Ralstonia insidiosa]